MKDGNMNETEKKEVPKDAEQASEPVTVVSNRTQSRRIIFGIIVAVLVCLTAGFAGAQLYTRLAGMDDGTTSSHQTVENDGNKAVTKEEEDIANVVKKVSPSVVSVTNDVSGSS